MTELENDLNRIKQEKLNKIIPENIKKGVNILGVTGTLEAGGGTPVEGAKQFASIDEMNTSTGNKEGDLAIVYGLKQTTINGDTESIFRNMSSMSGELGIFFPETVTLPTTLPQKTYEFHYMDRYAGYGSVGTVILTNRDFKIQPMGPDSSNQYNIVYTSSDGQHYTRTEFFDGSSSNPLSNPVNNFGRVVEPMDSEPIAPEFGYFMQVLAYIDTFNGLFEFKENAWKIAPTQLNVKAEEVYKSTFYGPNGVEIGTLTENVSDSFVDINAKIIYEIQQKYNAMPPRVLTDTDKTIDKNIYFIPTKINGTPLLDTSSVTDMQWMFDHCLNLTSIPLLNTSSVTDMSWMFYYCTNLVSVPELDTSNVINMYDMFSNCTNLTSIPLLDTSSATNMSSMFAWCTNLTEIPLLDTSSATSMSGIFYNCTNLTTIPELNTSSVTDMSDMFKGCTNLTSIPLLNTSKVTNMSRMFNSCANLVTVPLLNTSNVTDMYDMFSNCTNLTSIPLLDTSSATNMHQIFQNCLNLVTIPVLDTSKITDSSNVYDMFENCPKLSDESLNNILQTCINAKSLTSSNILGQIGLSQAQINKCKTLSNYQAFLDAGWTA